MLQIELCEPACYSSLSVVRPGINCNRMISTEKLTIIESGKFPEFHRSFPGTKSHFL